jgi:hypothetical protein
VVGNDSKVGGARPEAPSLTDATPRSGGGSVGAVGTPTQAQRVSIVHVLL